MNSASIKTAYDIISGALPNECNIDDLASLDGLSLCLDAHAHVVQTLCDAGYLMVTDPHSDTHWFQFATSEHGDVLGVAFDTECEVATWARVGTI